MPEPTHGRPQRILDALARFERPLLAYAARLTGDTERARDVVQETFLRLCSRPEGEFERLEGRLGEWLYTVCRNLALDTRRKERPMATTNEAGVLDRPSGEPGPDSALLKSERSTRVLSALAALPENQREVLRLKFQHGLSYKEIAGVTSLSVGNVGFLIHRGLKSLRERLGADLGATEAGGAA